jgi:transcriptional regulator with XRE-family HTH domain
MTASRYTRAREMSGLSRGQAVKLLTGRGWIAWSDGVLADIESGEHDPGVSVRAMLADLYGVSTAWLRGAAPVIPASAERILHQAVLDARVSPMCAAELLELFGAIYTPERP